MSELLDRPLNSYHDRYELLDGVEDKELNELYLLLSHAKALEDELKHALGKENWQRIDSALSAHVTSVRPLDFQKRKDVFIRSSMVMENTRDLQIDFVLENRRWAIRFMCLTTLSIIIWLTVVGVSIFGPEELSATTRQMILPNSAIPVSLGLLALSNASRYSLGSNRVQHDLITDLDSTHQEAADLASI